MDTAGRPTTVVPGFAGSGKYGDDDRCGSVGENRSAERVIVGGGGSMLSSRSSLLCGVDHACSLSRP